MHGIGEGKSVEGVDDVAEPFLGLKDPQQQMEELVGNPGKGRGEVEHGRHGQEMNDPRNCAEVGVSLDHVGRKLAARDNPPTLAAQVQCVSR